MSDAPSMYWENGKLIIRASQINCCTKSLVAQAQGFDRMDPPDSVQERFDRGHELEAEIVQRMVEKEGLTLLDKSQHEVEFEIIKGKVIIRGHLDGLAVNDALTTYVLEAKTMSSNMFGKYRASGLGDFKNYQWQVSVYMYATGLPLVFGTLDIDNNNLTADRYSNPPIDLGKIRMRALQLWVAATNPALPDSCDKTTFPCPVFYLHTDAETTVIDDVELANMLTARHAAAKRANEWAKKRGDLDEKIAAKAADLGVARGSVDDGTSFSVSFGQRRTLNEEQLVRDHPFIDLEIYRETIRNKRPTIRVTPPKESE